ncbi:hypothetical protein EYZ11_009522 [Aspergillus tanneri]|uniref:Short-chain dehydrogenases/reductase n=1 Tax=Aspergillus tanneri TaxID=1220188 RepID=A0A4V3UNG2_9EURO|nr:uncharacterized protein ATNIH1004_010267 [Aspergillus tanneri]KAA8643498.1 hypothetical protein ATNIH1004_010267 [Aspergillus tanneri]THC91014.1 hypothetical protein EYZ11_009522 [Aspergillus tanneri]
MPTLTQARTSNAAISSHTPELVAVFVGATSGIGEATAKEFARAVKKPTIHLVGRNQTTGSRILDELKAANPKGSFYFIQSDVSLLRNVDDVCAKIKDKEDAIDLLFMTTGHLAGSKNDTTEGLENNHALRYYSRMRFIYNLLPQLKASEGPARVVSVLGAGQEGKIELDNLDLQKKWTFLTASTYAVTMNSLAMEHLAAQHPSISFIHTFPGFVRTPLLNNTLGSIAGSIVGLLTRPMSMSPQESAQRNLYLATSAAYPPKQPKSTSAIGVPLVEGVLTSISSIGKSGGGSYILHYDGSDSTNASLMNGYRERGFPRKVWEHTLECFKKVIDPAE